MRTGIMVIPSSFLIDPCCRASGHAGQKRTTQNIKCRYLRNERARREHVFPFVRVLRKLHNTGAIVDAIRFNFKNDGARLGGVVMHSRVALRLVKQRG